MTTKERDHNTCGGCGFRGPEGKITVEAGGIYYCPNPFCTITGAWSVRTKLGFQIEKPDGGEMTPLGLFLMNWAMKNIELAGGKVPKHWERFKDESVLLETPEPVK